MSAPLPSISREDFRRLLGRHSPEPLDGRALDACYVHYQELALWNRRLSLIGPGTADEVVARHFGESLAALPLIPPGARTAVDVGSGAGFPGLVLAAAKPGMETTLVEARERKWSFLQSVARKASLPCRCLNARVQLPLPAGLPDCIDVLTARALKLPPEILGAVARRMGPEGRVLLWVGEKDPEIPPDLAPADSVKLEGSERRRILCLRPLEPER
ncbi:MAG TPA: RsmG family class I SAM-dependent methyltransferase [Thermoanaerobaculia bacterium]|nr:RsmG family class I SAM-dependent methyltransferase [Thermoanaerobaculia bacterium]